MLRRLYQHQQWWQWRRQRQRPMVRSVSSDNKVAPCEFLEIDAGRCSGCAACVAECRRVLGAAHAALTLDPARRKVAATGQGCVACGRCVVCPLGGIAERAGGVEAVESAAAQGRPVVIQAGPAACVSIGELFGERPGGGDSAVAPWKLSAAAREAGLASVETALGGDLTVVEEARELLARMEARGPWPLMTSCCAAWQSLVSLLVPAAAGVLLSSTKSPMAALAPLLRKYWAPHAGIADPAKLFHVAVMPCIAKKKEATRVGSEIDAVLTTREFATLLRRKGVTEATWAALRRPSSTGEEDEPMFGSGSGAAQLFGVTGGVTEAVLRTFCEMKSGRPLDQIELLSCRGTASFREASIEVGRGFELKFAIVHGPSQVRRLLDRISAGETLPWHFVEVMLCNGGCAGGSGQPLHSARDSTAFLDRRIRALYNSDRMQPVRKSHQNPSILALYADLPGSLGTPVISKKLLLPNTTDATR
jgi:NADH-quinone oxidoreductase subunit G/NADP-reducing hydrogenase subunit HndD